MHDYGIVYLNLQTKEEIRLRMKSESHILAEREAEKCVPEGYALWGVFYHLVDKWFIEDYPQTLEDWLAKQKGD